MRQKITKTAVDNLKPESRDAFLWDTEITGFGCKITPAGRKVYVLQYRTEAQDSRKAIKAHHPRQARGHHCGQSSQASKSGTARGEGRR